MLHIQRTIGFMVTGQGMTAQCTMELLAKQVHGEIRFHPHENKQLHSVLVLLPTGLLCVPKMHQMILISM